MHENQSKLPISEVPEVLGGERGGGEREGLIRERAQRRVDGRDRAQRQRQQPPARQLLAAGHARAQRLRAGADMWLCTLQGIERVFLGYHNLKPQCTSFYWQLGEG